MKTKLILGVGLIAVIPWLHGAEAMIGEASNPEKPAAPAEQASGFNAEEDASYERGGLTFKQLCFLCHGPDGKGAPILDDPDDRRMAPPLSGSKRVLGRPEYIITALLYGITGPVDEMNYEGLMIPMASYGDPWMADVASYVRNSFDNYGSMITTNDVARVRKRIGEREEPFTIPEILSMLPAALTNQSSWKVSASHQAEKAVDAINGASSQKSWDSGAPQSDGMWFQIELPEPVPIWEVNFENPPPAPDAKPGFPQTYKVETSLDGKDWSKEAVEGKRADRSTAVAINATQAKFVRIALTAAAANSAPWSISRIEILQPGRSAPAPTGTRGNRFE